MNTSEFVAIVSTLLACGSAISAILTFANSRKKVDLEHAQTQTWLRDQLQYVRDSIDDIKVDVKEFTTKQNSMNDQVTRIDERINSLEMRLSVVEKKIK